MRMALPEEGVSFEEYERVGYSRFVLKGVSVDSPQATIEVDRLEAYSPLAWVWNAVRGNDLDSFVAVGKVDVIVLEPEAEPEPESGEVPANLLEAVDVAKESLGLVAYWVPHTSIELIEARLDEQTLAVHNILWRDLRFSLSASHDAYAEYEVDILAEVEASEMRLEIDSEGAKTNLKGKLIFAEVDAEATMTVVFQGNVLDATARFDETGWLPVEANWEAVDWMIAAENINLGGPYSSYGFNISGNWDNGVYRNDIEGRAVPIDDVDYALPEVDFATTVSGDFVQVEIESFHLSAPGIDARTAESVSLALGDLKLAGEMKFDIDLICRF